MSAMAPAQNSGQETEVVTGVIAGITQKGPDKWQVAVQQAGSQYSKNLWTKDADLIGQLSQMIGQPASFMCGASHWTNQQGAPVRSLWINGVGPAQQQQPVQVQPQAQPMAGMMPMQSAAPPPGQFQQPQQQVWGAAQPTHTPPQGWAQAERDAAPQAQTWEDPKQGMIHRQTASKVASILISHLPAEERTFSTLIMLCERLVAYYDHGLAALGAPNPEGHAASTGFAPPPHGDEDDIPF